MGEDGFVRAMCPSEGEGPVWLDGLCAVDDGQGQLRLIAHYSRVPAWRPFEHGIAVLDEGEEVRQAARFDLSGSGSPSGHPPSQDEH